MAVAFRIVRLALLLGVAPALAGAQQPPVRTYTTVDGLPSDAVTHIEFDSRGFLWVFAGDGVSRFDGARFSNYNTDDGLPDRRVFDLLETADGEYWFATARGLCRFNRSGPGPLCEVLNPDDAGRPTAFNVLLEDGPRIWCGTARGLYVLEPSENRRRLRLVDLAIPTDASRAITALLKDRSGAIWIGTLENGLYRLAGERVEHYDTRHGLPMPEIASLYEDRDGGVWAGIRSHVRGGLCRLSAAPDPSRPIVEAVYLPTTEVTHWIHTVFETRDAKLLVGAPNGLFRLMPPSGGGPRALTRFPEGRIPCSREVWRLAEDRHGNLWVATDCGLTKISLNGFTFFSTASGLAHPVVNAIVESNDGELVVITPRTDGVDLALNLFSAGRFTTIVPRRPAQSTAAGWGWSQTIQQDQTGRWWFPTASDLVFVFPPVERTVDIARVLPAARPLPRAEPGSEAFRVYPDRRGNLWIALAGTARGLARLDAGSNIVRDVTAEAGLPRDTLVTAFGEDRSGQVWIGTADQGVLRYAGGRYARFSPGSGPGGWILATHVDSRGTVWLASSTDGLVRVDDQSSDRPTFVRFSTSNGLSSNNARSLTGDNWGRLYVGNSHGVDRFDPSTGAVRWFTLTDGLPKGVIENAYRDRRGNLWFGSTFGLSRFVPAADRVRRPPAIYLTAVDVSGVRREVFQIGGSTVALSPLRRAENSLTIEYAGLSADLDEPLKYQFKLDGKSDWSTATEQRTVNYANLSGGAYRFLVRAVDAEGHVSDAPALLEFAIPPPIWMRWWFLVMAAAATSLGAFAAHRYRVRRLLEVAGMRTRIATDLHDDIGANLTRIAVLSEVARQKTTDAGTRDRLDSIATISRESVSAMSDIVWAINPERDGLLDLVRRMRQHAGEVFSAGEIELHFSAPEADRPLKLDIDLRRDVFLVFKEAVNNAARHSGGSKAEVEFHADAHLVTLRVSDDGRGFDAAAASEGQGLDSMRRRAGRLAGTLEIASGSAGTTVTLTAPVQGRRAARAAE
jgi:ligand-binding sensor domain-containing protein/signal transduction histidine kinase